MPGAWNSVAVRSIAAPRRSTRSLSESIERSATSKRDARPGSYLARRSTVETRATNSRGLNGFRQVIVGADFESAQPIALVNARVSMMIGTSDSRRSTRATSRPSSFGRPRSRTTRSGPFLARDGERACPVAGQSHRVARACQIVASESSLSVARRRRRVRWAW
jgi:hypothetical protein